jgi:hypothetical protein
MSLLNLSSPPTGPRKARPDDRLQRGPSKRLTLYGEGVDNLHCLYWMPAFAGMTSEIADGR